MNFQELIMEVDENNYSQFLDNNIAVLNFFSDWHMNCLMVLPIIEELAEELNGKICFGKINIEESEELAERHGVCSVPSLIIFKNKQVIGRIDSVSEEIIRDQIYSLMKNGPEG